MGPRLDRKRTRCLLALAMLVALPAAQASEHKGWIYNGLTGWGTVSADQLDDSSLGSNSNLGYRWGAVGLEVGHSFFGSVDDDIVVGALDIHTHARFKGWNAGLNFNHDLSDKWSVQGRAGVFAWDVEGYVDDNLTTAVDFDDSGKDWYAGASATYQWRKRSSIGIGYTHFKAGDADLDLWGVQSEFRF